MACQKYANKVGIIIDNRIGYGLEMHVTHVINLPLTPILNAAYALSH